jgi:chorismate dehydratase
MPILRLGAPSDLDARALVWGLQAGGWNDRLSLTLGTYRQLGEWLDARAIDAALLSSTEYALRAEPFDVVPGLAIVSDGHGSLCRLAHGGSLANVTHLRGATVGHAGEVLAPLLFAASGRRVLFEPFHEDPLTALSPGEARLLCGSDALRADELGITLDLGNAWTSLTGKPFVWACWAAVPGRIDKSLYGLMHTMRSHGKHHLDRIAGEASLGSAERMAVIHAILQNVRYRLGRAEIAGAGLFWSEAVRLGLLPKTVTPRFLPLSTGSSCHRESRGQRI